MTRFGEISGKVNATEIIATDITSTNATLTNTTLSKVNDKIIYVKTGQTIQQTINSITDATAENPYVVMVPPGVFNEQITMRDYVSLKGSGRRVTDISFAPASPAEPVLWYASNSIISNMSIKNLRSSSGWGMSAQQNTENVILDNCYIFGEGDAIRSQIQSNPDPFTTDMLIYNCELGSYYDGLLVSGNVKVFNSIFTLTNYHSALHRVCAIVPDADLDGDFYNCIFNVTNDQTHSEAGAIIYTNYMNSMTFTFPIDNLNFYNCKFNISQTGDPGFAYGFKTAEESTINLYGGSIECNGAGTAIDLDNSNGGILNVYGTKYTTTVGTITGDSKVPGNINVGGIVVYDNNAAAVSGGLVAGDFYRTGDILKVVH